MARTGGQTFPKSTEIRNSVAFRAFFSVFFRPFQSVAADSVSEQLLQLPWRTNVLGGQFWLSKESVSTSATDCRIPAPICTKYGLQKSVHAKLMDCTLYIKSFANTYIGFRKALMGRLWLPKHVVVLFGETNALGQFWLRSSGWNPIGPVPERSWDPPIKVVYVKLWKRAPRSVWRRSLAGRRRWTLLAVALLYASLVNRGSGVGCTGVRPGPPSRVD